MHKWLSYFFLLFYLSKVAGQTLPVKTFTSKDGLINDQVTALLRDDRGLLWVATQFGISWFDGKRFYEPKIEAHTGQLYVTRLYKDERGIIWIPTFYNGIYRYSAGKFDNFLPQPEQLTSTRNNVFDIVQYDEARYVIATDAGVFSFDGKTFSPFDKENRFIQHQINCVSKLNDGSVLIGVKDGLWLYRNNNNSFRKPVLILKDHSIYNILIDKNNVWLSTNKGCYYFEDSDKLERGAPKIYFKGIRTTSVTKGREDDVWISADKKYKIKDEEIQSYGEESGFPVNSAIYCDKQGLMWFTSAHGFTRLNTTYYESYSLHGTGAHTMTVCLGYDVQHNLWLGSYDGLSKKTQDKFLVQKRFKNQNIGFVSWMINSNESNLLAGTGAGVLEINKHEVQKKFDLKTSKAYKDETGQIWLGTENGDVYTIVDNTLHHVALTGGVTDFIDAIYKDTNGHLWIGYRGYGLIKFHLTSLTANAIKEYTPKTNFSDLRVRCSTPDNNGNLIVGTRTNGVFIFSINDDKYWHVNSSKGLSGNWVKSIAVNKNDIYLATNRGVDLLRGNNYNAPVIRNLHFSNEAIEKAANYVSIQKDTVWIATDDGVIKYLPKQDLPDTTHPPIFITQVSINGKIDSSLVPYSTIKNSLRLSYNSNVIEFGFAGVNLKDGELYYTYILEGQDKKWTSPGERNFVSYNLPPGNYTFKVKAVNKDGIESKEAAFFQFSIIPPFWKTTPFVLICTVAIILLFYLIYRYRIAQVIKLEKMRSRISADLHDDLGTGLSRIKFLSETLKLKKHDDPAVEKSINKISSYSDEMSDKIGEIVWALNSKNDTLADLIAYIRSYAVEYLMNNNISCEANPTLQTPNHVINGEDRRNIFLSVKESLYNIVKHSKASKVLLNVEISNHLRIVIHDNGTGIDWSNIRKFSNGLENIKQRMENSRGAAEFTNDNGTKVILSIPLNI